MGELRFSGVELSGGIFLRSSDLDFDSVLSTACLEEPLEMIEDTVLWSLDSLICTFSFFRGDDESSVLISFFKLSSECVSCF